MVCTMSVFKFIKSIFIIGVGISTFEIANATTVTLDFDHVVAGTSAITSIDEDGYTLTSAGFNIVSPGNFNSNGTTSIYTQNNSAVTLVKNGGGLFDLLSIDFGEVFNASTPIVSVIGTKQDSSVVISGTSVSGPNYWTTQLTFNNLFSDLISVTIARNAAGPFLFQFDNIVLFSEDTQIGVSAVPVPAALPMMASGLLAFGFVAYRRNKNNKQVK